MARSLAQNHAELDELLREQAALRRVATLVAHGAESGAVFKAVADEVEELLGADISAVVRFEADATVTVMGVHGGPHAAGARVELDPDYVVARVHDTGRPARFDTPDATAAGMPEVVRSVGIRSALASPIEVAGKRWGAITVAFLDRSLPSATERRLADFTELVATAISNAEVHAELTASRTRVIAAADEARRRIERDLHDGAQQRLASVVLKLRTAQSALPVEFEELHAQFGDAIDELVAAVDELRDYSRGIHPAVLTTRGLAPALKALARRSVVPVELNVRVDTRLATPAETGAYFVVSEALTNAAKHAKASAAAVEVAALDGVLYVSVRDDGTGGADFENGSGLVGMRDRVAALGGRISIESPRGSGTTILVEIPLDGSPSL